ncbi:MAG: D-glycero-beta-D-manno-heptose-7-phosphate kinase [Candidatus Firestonebacteria bacterium]
MNTKKLKNILKRFKGKRVLVVGDIILDEYIFGKVNRISPEAPVPVVEIEHRNYLPGGAAYVATHINNLSGKVYLCGVIGDDNYGEEIYKSLQNDNISLDGLIKDFERPTIVKTRVISQHQQVVRIDYEKKIHININIVKKVLDYVKDIIKESDAVIISDYGKGVVIPPIFKEIIKLTHKFDIPIVVDPKPTYCLMYKGVTVITPNTNEAGASLSRVISDDKTLIKVGKELLKKLRSKAVLITRGEAGMSLFERGKDIINIPTYAKEVYDVTGAGDTVVSVLALSLAGGANILDSANLANIAAGIVVGKIGTAKVTLDEIKQILDEK